jgi:hypothetical protein
VAPPEFRGITKLAIENVHRASGKTILVLCSPHGIRAAARLVVRLDASSACRELSRQVLLDSALPNPVDDITSLK